MSDLSRNFRSLVAAIILGAGLLPLATLDAAAGGESAAVSKPSDKLDATSPAEGSDASTTVDKNEPTNPADGAVRAQHGDWQVVCKPPPPGAKNEVCALVQSVTAEDRNNVGLTIYFQRFSNGTQVLRVFAPLGVLLPPGVGLKIDGADVGHAPFHRCQTFACYAQVTVDEKLVEQLKTGKTAIFIIFQTEEAGIGIPISLAGFADAAAALN